MKPQAVLPSAARGHDPLGFFIKPNLKRHAQMRAKLFCRALSVAIGNGLHDAAVLF